MLITLNSDDYHFYGNTLLAKYQDRLDSEQLKKVAEKLRKEFEIYQRPDHEIDWIGLPLPMALKKQYDIEVENGNERYVMDTPLKELLEEEDRETSMIRRNANDRNVLE